MRLIARETMVPVPHVHYFDASLDNELGCPFILMDFVDGVNGQDAWFDTSIDEVVLEQRRARTLQDLAKAMLQLNKFTYSSGGAPLYARDGSQSGIGSMRVIDTAAEWETLRTDDSEDESPIFYHSNPFTDPLEFLLSARDRRQSPPDVYSQGVFILLRLFIQWIPQETLDPKFVLTHPDLDIQNIVVREDGALAGIIDWDGVAALPRCLGNERFLSWLTRDWDPAKYAYGMDLGKEAEDNDDDNDEQPYRENSPTELVGYRSMYLSYLRGCVAEEGNPQVTGRSLLIDNLHIAAGDPLCTTGIVEKVFQESLRALQWRRTLSESLTKQEFDDGDVDLDELYLYEFVTELLDGEFDRRQLAEVKQGFLALCTALDDLDEPFWKIVEEEQ